MKSSTPEMQKKGMEAWMHWMTAHKASIVDGGAPLGKTTRVDANGRQRREKRHRRLFGRPGRFPRRRRQDVRQGPPPLQMMPGAWVEVVEIMPMPGM